MYPLLEIIQNLSGGRSKLESPIITNVLLEFGKGDRRQKH